MDYLTRLDLQDEAEARADCSAREQAQVEEMDSCDVFTFEAGHLDEWMDPAEMDDDDG